MFHYKHGHFNDFKFEPENQCKERSITANQRKENNIIYWWNLAVPSEYEICLLWTSRHWLPREPTETERSTYLKYKYPLPKYVLLQLKLRQHFLFLWTFNNTSTKTISEIAVRFKLKHIDVKSNVRFPGTYEKSLIFFAYE